MITVYTKPQCVQCDATKRWLTNNNLEFETVDITEDQEAFDRIVALGFRAAPVVESEAGSWSGFNPDKLSLLI